ncbi:MAG TPA: DUF222 domain-containing protein [Gaiella sp.]|nr:DUF222 domain-containing protein [Gaiella sp.]
MATDHTSVLAQAEERWREQMRREDELAALSAHLAAATARWVELAWEFFEDVDSDDPAGFLAYRFGVTRREACEYLRVAEALRELPETRAAFARGELSFSKVRALTRVATASSEEGLLELAGALTASQLERALRVYRRVAAAEARETHELEFVNWFFEDDGSLYLRARLAAEDGTLLVKALEAARERIVAHRREERATAREAEASAASEGEASVALATPPPRSVGVEAMLELAETSLAASEQERVERTRLIVHVDAAALSSDRHGRSELEDGPVISPETARRLGCDAELVAQVERDGLPLSAGRRRRTVPPALRRLLEARDGETCCFPGCERRRHLQAHHLRHWAHGGETSLANLVLLCFHHHRFVHEGGYTIEDDPAGSVRFRNRHGVLSPNMPPRPPPGSLEALLAENDRSGLTIGPKTNRNGGSSPFDLGYAVSAISSVIAERGAAA